MKQLHLTPKMNREFVLLGERIKLARLRRKFTVEQVSERAGIDTITLTNIESGSYDISIGVYVCVLCVLGLEKDVYAIASNDILGFKLQDIELLNKST